MADFSQEQLQGALQRAQQAGDSEAVGHIQSLLSESAGVAPTQQPQQGQQGQPPAIQTNPYAAFAKSAVESVPEAAGGLAMGVPGAVAGASMLAPMGPVGAGVGAVLGGLGFGSIGAHSAGKIGKSLVNKFVSPQVLSDLGFSPEQRAAEKEQNPASTLLGEYGLDFATMKAPIASMDNKVLRFAANNLWAKASPTQKEAWAIADQWGLKLQPSQIREDKAAQIVGREANTRIMNQKLAEATGDTNPVKYVDQKWLDSRFDALGAEYDKIYNDPTLGAAVSNLPAMPGAGNTMGGGTVLAIPLQQDAQDGITRLFADQIPMPTQLKNRMVQGLQGIQQNGFMSGDDFRFIMSGLKKVQRETSDGNVKYAVGDAITNINNSLAQTNPTLKAKLDELNPKYQALLTAQDARNKDIIDSNGNVNAYELGQMLKDNKGNPLYRIGQIGEALGIGSHAHGVKYKNARDAKDEYLYGITPLMNVAKKAAGLAKGEGIGMGAKYLNDIKGRMPNVGLFDVFKRGGPALETTYSALNPKKDEVR